MEDIENCLLTDTGESWHLTPRGSRLFFCSIVCLKFRLGDNHENRKKILNQILRKTFKFVLLSRILSGAKNRGVKCNDFPEPNYFSRSRFYLRVVRRLPLDTMLVLAACEIPLLTALIIKDQIIETWGTWENLLAGLFESSNNHKRLAQCLVEFVSFRAYAHATSHLDFSSWITHFKG